MNKETQAVLLAADDPEHCEVPPTGDWEEDFRKVEDLASTLGKIVGRPFEIDRNVQDASFLTELASYHDVRTSSGTVRHVVLAIRFSAFGQLFTTWQSQGTAGVPTCPPELEQRVVAEVSDRGFVYVAAADLDSRYTGSNRFFDGRTWWSRFLHARS